MHTPPITHNQRGSVALLFALILPIFAGMVGVGLEVNSWYRQKSDLQKATDAAAIATANALNPSACGQYTGPEELSCLEQMASANLAADGFGQGNVTVIVTLPAGTEAKVCASLADSRLLSAIDQGDGTTTISTCATATMGTAAISTPLCAVTSGETSDGSSIHLSGDSNLNIASSCSVMSSSTSSNAIELTGTSVITAEDIIAAGAIVLNPGSVTATNLVSTGIQNPSGSVSDIATGNQVTYSASGTTVVNPFTCEGVAADTPCTPLPTDYSTQIPSGMMPVYNPPLSFPAAYIATVCDGNVVYCGGPQTYGDIWAPGDYTVVPASGYQFTAINLNTTGITMTLYPGTYSSIQNNTAGDVITMSPPISGGMYQTTGAVAAENGTINLQPGVYSSITANSGGTINLASGVYIIYGYGSSGGFSNNGGTITGSDVTIIFTGTDNFSQFVGGATNTTLTPSTSGIYQGILFYSPPGNGGTFSWNNGDGVVSNFSGNIYLPGWDVSLNGNPPSGTCLNLVAKTLQLNGWSLTQGSCPADSRFITVTENGSGQARLTQ